MGQRQKKSRPVSGWLNLDKPLGMTSTTAVAVVKRLFGAQKAGHAGTLDPLATGCLPIAAAPPAVRPAWVVWTSAVLVLVYVDARTTWLPIRANHFAAACLIAAVAAGLHRRTASPTAREGPRAARAAEPDAAASGVW